MHLLDECVVNHKFACVLLCIATAARGTTGRSPQGITYKTAFALGVLPADHHLTTTSKRSSTGQRNPPSVMYIPTGVIPLALVSALGTYSTSQHVLHTGQHPLHKQSGGELKVAIIGAGKYLHELAKKLQTNIVVFRCCGLVSRVLVVKSQVKAWRKYYYDYLREKRLYWRS